MQNRFLLASWRLGVIFPGFLFGCGSAASLSLGLRPMKRCTYCGKEYDDAATVCVIDFEPLVQVVLKSPSNQIDAPTRPLTRDIRTASTGQLREFRNVRQIPGEPPRRWFTSQDMELVVWCDESAGPIGFQLCYKDGSSEYALTWKPDCGFSHKRIDDGEERPAKHKATPILTADVPASANLISERFALVSARLPVEFAEFVGKELRESGK